MNRSASESEQPLLGRIGETEGKLGSLGQDLGAIDNELERLATQRERYELVAQTCGSLERLGELGAQDLFWGEDIERSKAADHVRQARTRIDAFLSHVTKIEERRRGLVSEISQGQEILAILHDDLEELREEEEERRNEWVIERDISLLPERAARMPWTSGGEDDRRLRKSLGSSLAAALLLALLMPLIHLPIVVPTEVPEVPERLAHLIEHERPRPLPPQRKVEEEKPKQTKQRSKQEKTKPKRVSKQVVAQQPSPKPNTKAPGPPQEQPKQRAESSGILAFSNTFSNLAKDLPEARLGSDARINNSGDVAVGAPKRAMVTTQAPGSSGGINLASLSRDVGGGGNGNGPGGGMAAVKTARVVNSIGGGGGGGGDRPLAGSGVAGRTDEEIQIVFDRYKASLYRLYNRELRKDPTLRGQMILRLTIEPDGSVSMCKLQSTDMNAPDLVQQVVARVRTFDFGAKDVAPLTISYPIDFLPAA